MKTKIEAAMQELVTAGWANDSVGDVNGPGGHVSLIDLDSERAMMAQVLGDSGEEAVQAIRPGWYVVQEDSDGNVAVTGPASEAEARFSFRQMALATGATL